MRSSKKSKTPNNRTSSDGHARASETAVGGRKRPAQTYRTDGQQLKRLNVALVKLTGKLKNAGNDHVAALHAITEVAAETLHVERVGIWMYDAGRTSIKCIDLYEKSSRQHSGGTIFLAKDYPEYFKAIEGDRIVDANDAHKDKRTSEFSESYLTENGITSMMDVPIRIGGNVWGVLCHEHTGTIRQWSYEEQSFAGSMADAVSVATESNERLVAEKRLRESEERLRSLSEASNEGIVIHDTKKILEVNLATTQIFGYTEEELIGMSPLNLAAPQSQDLVRKNMLAGIETPYEALGQRKDGSTFWGELAGRPFFYKGSTYRVVAIRDITLRKKAENDLEISLSIMRATLESTADGILVVDKEGKINGYNSKFAQMWRIPDNILVTKDDDKAIGYVLEQLTEPDVFINKVKELYAHPEQESFDVLHFKNGRVFERYSKPQFSRSEIIGRVWSFRDVTERTRAEEEIKKLNTNLEKIVQERTREVFDLYNNSPIGYHSLDTEGNLVKINDTELKLLGYTREEMMGRNLVEFLANGSKSIFKKSYAAFREDGYIKDLELLFVRKDKSTFTASINATAKRDQYGNIVAARINVIDISEKKKLEEALRESELKYRTMIEAAGDVVYTTDQRGLFTYVSPRCVALTGYEPADLIGKSFLEIVVPEWKDEVGKFYFEQFRNNQTETVYSFPIITREGEIKWVEQTVTQLKPEGKLIGHQSIVRDITKRVKAEEELKATTKFLDMILNNIPNMIFVKEVKDFKFLRVNRSCEQLTGYSSQDMIGKNVYDLFPKDQADFFTGKDQEVMKQGSVVDIPEEIISTPSGDRWLHTKKIPVLNENGDPLYLLGISEDITERKRANTRIEEYNQRIRTIITNAPTAVVVIDELGQITNWNSKSESIFGWKAAEVMGKVMHEIIMPSHYRNDHKKGFDHFLKNGEGPILGKVLEVTAIRKDGTEFPIELSVSSARIKDKQLFTAFMTDITDRKKAEEKLNEARAKEAELAKARDQLIEELKHSNKEVEQFAYIASHDLQEPLRIITNYLMLLQKTLGNKIDEDTVEYIHYITDAASRMKALISDLLEYSRIGRHTAEMQEVNCNDVLQVVFADMALSIKESGAEITTSPMPVITGYPVEIKSLFQNLLSNAIKFRKKDVKPIIRINAEDKGNQWVFSIKDNGIGIDKKYHEKIFVIFQRLHTQREYPGTGIGLSHCNKIIELHKGKLWLESEEGKGSTFYFSIPKHIENEKKIGLHLTGG